MDEIPPFFTEQSSSTTHKKEKLYTISFAKEQDKSPKVLKLVPLTIQ
jgi:hypothetical protein